MYEWCKLLQTLANAHVDGAMILGEPFKTNEPFDFGNQDITTRIHKLIPLLAEQRLTPPPEESYSLHRKLAGAFLLCSNMRAKIRCKEFFDDIYAKYQQEARWSQRCFNLTASSCRFACDNFMFYFAFMFIFVLYVSWNTPIFNQLIDIILMKIVQRCY